jgi:hypothetical protein
MRLLTEKPIGVNVGARCGSVKGCLPTRSESSRFCAARMGHSGDGSSAGRTDCSRTVRVRTPRTLDEQFPIADPMASPMTPSDRTPRASCSPVPVPGSSQLLCPQANNLFTGEQSVHPITPFRPGRSLGHSPLFCAHCVGSWCEPRRPSHALRPRRCRLVRDPCTFCWRCGLPTA